MSSFESRSSSNANHVRFFERSSLVESIACQKWDLIKIVCIQPFNKYVQYGLSFVVVHITDEEKPTVKKSLVPERFLIKKPAENDNRSKLFAGKFKLRDESPVSESDTAMGLFNRWKTKKAIVEQSTAISIREASNKPELMKEALTPKLKKIIPSWSSSSKEDVDNNDGKKLKVLDRNRMDLVFGDEEEKPNEKFDKMIQKDKERLEKEIGDRKTNSSSKRASTSSLESKSTKKIKCQSLSSTDDGDNNAMNKSKEKMEVASTPKASKTSLNSNALSDYKSQTKPTVDSPKLQKFKVDENDNRKERVFKPFNKLLEGVTIAISGIQASFLSTFVLLSDKNFHK